MKGSNNRFFTVALVAAWYSSNIGVLLLNKYLLSNYGFKYPIFLTMCHMTACSLLSYVAIAWMKVVPLQSIRSRVQFFKISALSLVFCVSVVFGNISLRYLPVSFNQAIGATTPFFTAVFAYLMTFKREAWLTYLTLVPVVTGVIIASGGEPSFHLFGFIICVAATAARALKSVLQGILLSSEGEKLNSMNLLLYMSPMAVVFLLPATLIMEENVVGITLALARDDSKIIWYLLFNSALAYFVNLTNFLVTKHTSALTLQVSPDYLFKLAFIPFCFFKCTFHSNKLSVVSSVGSWDIRFWWLSNHKICITLSALSWSLFCFFVSSVAM
ncbi:putative sugar phosphate/phosphate translocator isoform B [Glycine soja]|uniref:Putative sugar phosphate/phosphate translocator isoform B n=1 Tax=Glycine soja TaxID=3848 RepID=A0A445FNG8_GLYSO|nr:putative sugar phosphate/phosphate translocator isoform B [Glycine soja]